MIQKNKSKVNITFLLFLSEKNNKNTKKSRNTLRARAEKIKASKKINLKNRIIRPLNYALSLTKRE